MRTERECYDSPRRGPRYEVPDQNKVSFQSVPVPGCRTSPHVRGFDHESGWSLGLRNQRLELSGYQLMEDGEFRSAGTIRVNARSPLTARRPDAILRRDKLKRPMRCVVAEPSLTLPVIANGVEHPVAQTALQTTNFPAKCFDKSFWRLEAPYDIRLRCTSSSWPDGFVLLRRRSTLEVVPRSDLGSNKGPAGCAWWARRRPRSAPTMPYSTAGFSTTWPTARTASGVPLREAPGFARTRCSAACQPSRN
jgi:hypothetical protein